MTEERHEEWEAGVTYVVGHQRPDTDAIAAALAQAWYLTATGEEGVEAARAGQPGPQTLFALERFGQPPPRLLTGVAPTFRHAARLQAAVAPEAPLSEAMLRLAEGGRVVPVVDGEGRPAGVVTPLALARHLSQAADTGGALQRPCRELAEATPVFSAADRISDHRSVLLRSDADDFPVVDEGGRYVGMATRAGIVEPPRARLFLVDHNELSQAVLGAEEAEIVGVLDHHHLGNPPTAAPIRFVVEPVGSTCTLVAEQCRARGLTVPPALAGMMLSGILSDTLVYRSPTTTERDRSMAEWLTRSVSLDVAAFGEELLRAAPGMASRSAAEILDADRKDYRMGGRSMSISQVEVTSLVELPHRREELLAAIDERRRQEGLALVALMVTDVVSGRSRLLCQGERRLLATLPFPRVIEHDFDLGAMVSRKKQLVPLLQGLFEQVYGGMAGGS